MRFAIVFSIFFPAFLFAQNFDGNTSLTTSERSSLQNRLERFYANPNDPSLMDQVQTKFNPRKKTEVHPHAYLKLDTRVNRDPLINAAGLKATDSYQNYQCNHFLKPHFKGLSCSTEPKLRKAIDRAAIEANDQVSNLVDTWVDESEVINNIDGMPLKGQITQDVWSADYWQMRWGLTSYRPSTKIKYETYDEAVAAYKQPNLWSSLSDSLSPELLAREMITWSPAEKYDLTVGDEDFTLTNEQKAEGVKEKDENGKVPDWIGICDGWASATLFTPTPTRAVDAVGLNGAKVTWYPDEIRAVTALAWAHGNYQSNFISGRCEEAKKDVKKYPNGRVQNQDCFDSNPATFQRALANMIGIKKLPFIMDVSFDSEVWNSPVLSYQLEYFNPLDPKVTGSDWSKLAVPYDAAFKAKDRFQTPLTRGIRSADNKYDDSKIEKIVGVNAVVVYLDEADPHYGPTAKPNNTVRVVYSYDLELHAVGNTWIPTGGEWLSNVHPDFLWVPKRNSVVATTEEVGLTVDLSKAADEELSTAAATSSESGAPLCLIVKSLVEKSGPDGAKYSCGK